jgi:hypothetical protein
MKYTKKLRELTNTEPEWFSYMMIPPGIENMFLKVKENIMIIREDCRKFSENNVGKAERDKYIDTMLEKLFLLVGGESIYMQAVDKQIEEIENNSVNGDSYIRKCIFVCSHIRYDGQCDLLYKCLNSLINQEYCADIYLSVSYERKYKKEFYSKIINEYKGNITILIVDGQTYQMEHLRELTYRYADKYHLIMFCDDDDTYKYERVKVITEAYKAALKSSELIVNGVCETYLFKGSHKDPEFWKYSIHPELLKEFFNRCDFVPNMILLKHVYADVLLRFFFTSVMIENISGWVNINIENEDDVLYNYNRNNIHSVTGSKKTYEEGVSLTAYYEVLYCRTDEEFMKCMNKYKLNEHDIITLNIVYVFCKNILKKPFVPKRLNLQIINE